MQRRAGQSSPFADGALRARQGRWPFCLPSSYINLLTPKGKAQDPKSSSTRPMTPSRETQQDTAASDLGPGGWRGSEKVVMEGRVLGEEKHLERHQEVGRHRCKWHQQFLVVVGQKGSDKPTGVRAAGTSSWAETPYRRESSREPAPFKASESQGRRSPCRAGVGPRLGRSCRPRDCGCPELPPGWGEGNADSSPEVRGSPQSHHTLVLKDALHPVRLYYLRTGHFPHELL